LEKFAREMEEIAAELLDSVGQAGFVRAAVDTVIWCPS